MLRKYKKKDEILYTLEEKVDSKPTEDAHYKFKKLKDAKEKELE